MASNGSLKKIWLTRNGKFLYRMKFGEKVNQYRSAFLLDSDDLGRNETITEAFSPTKLRDNQRYPVAVYKDTEQNIAFKSGEPDWDAVQTKMAGDRPVVSRLFNQADILGEESVEFAGNDKPELAKIPVEVNGETKMVQMLAVEKESTNLFIDFISSGLNITNHGDYWEVIENSINTTHSAPASPVPFNSANIGEHRIISIEWKPNVISGDRNYAFGFSGNSRYNHVRINPQTKEVFGQNNLSGTLSHLGTLPIEDGWFRTQVKIISTDDYPTIEVGMTFGFLEGTNYTYQGNGTESVFLRKPKAEVSAYPTLYHTGIRPVPSPALPNFLPETGFVAGWVDMVWTATDSLHYILKSTIFNFIQNTANKLAVNISSVASYLELTDISRVQNTRSIYGFVIIYTASLLTIYISTNTGLVYRYSAAKTSGITALDDIELGGNSGTQGSEYFHQLISGTKSSFTDTEAIQLLSDMSAGYLDLKPEDFTIQ